MKNKEIIEKIEKVNSFLNKFKYSPDFFIKYLAKVVYENNYVFRNPIMVTWDLMKSCNLSCPFCSASASKYNKEDLVNWKKAISFIDRIDPLYLTIRGGEPSIHPYFFEILNELVSRRFFLEIVTNGTGIDEGIVSTLEKYNQDKLRIKVSLDSSDEKVNDSNRSCKSFYYANRALLLLSKSKIKNVRVQCVATEKTIPGIFELYQFLHKYNVNSFGISYILPTGKANDLKPKIINEMLIDQVIKCIEKYKLVGRIQLEKIHLGYWQTKFSKINMYNEEIDSNEIFRVKCGAGRWKLNIDSNGDIFPCDFLKFEKFKLGNIKDDIAKIWNSTLINQLRKIKREDKKECSTCNNKTCNTGCMGLAYEKYSDILRRDPNCYCNG